MKHAGRWLLLLLLLLLAFFLNGCTQPEQPASARANASLCICWNETQINLSEFMAPSFVKGSRADSVASIFYLNATEKCPERMNVTVAIFACKAYALSK